MKRDLKPTIMQQEFFELTLNIDDSRISAIELIGFLSNTEELFKSINQTLNSKYTVGYDSVSIDVLALEKGSFKMPLCIKKIANNPIFASTAGTLLGGIALNLLSNNANLQTITVGNDNVVIENKDLRDNRNTIHAVSNIAKMTLETDGIRDISVTYEKDNGNKKKFVLQKKFCQKLQVLK